MLVGMEITLFAK